MKNNKYSIEQRKYLSKIYKIFEENPDGRELLKCWENIHFCRQICLENQPVESAKRDGENRFIRTILMDIHRFKELMKEENNGKQLF